MAQVAAMQNSILTTDMLNSVLVCGGVELSSRHNYTAFGHSTNGLMSKTSFAGQNIEPFLKYYFLGNGYRGYRPTLLRFGEPDIYSPFGEGGINCYSYCKADPVNFTDPTGHISKGILKAAKELADGLSGSTTKGLLTSESEIRRISIKVEIQTVSKSGEISKPGLYEALENQMEYAKSILPPLSERKAKVIANTKNYLLQYNERVNKRYLPNGGARRYILKSPEKYRASDTKWSPGKNAFKQPPIRELETI